MMWTSDWENDSGLDGVEGGELEEEIIVMYMNVGWSKDATHQCLEGCARGDVVMAFVGKCWVEKKSGVGTQSYPDYVRLGSVSGGGKVACHVRRDLVDCCMLVGCENRFVCVKIVGVHIGGVYSKCGARVHEMLHCLGQVQALVGNGRWLLIGDWNAHHEEWSLDGRSDSVGKMLKEWQTSRGARVLTGRSHTFERRQGNGVVVSRIDFALAGGGVVCRGFSSR